jgi:hypothetical protein
MVPKSRLDAVIAQRRKLAKLLQARERENERLRQQLNEALAAAAELLDLRKRDHP